MEMAPEGSASETSDLVLKNIPQKGLVFWVSDRLFKEPMAHQVWCAYHEKPRDSEFEQWITVKIAPYAGHESPPTAAELRASGDFEELARMKFGRGVHPSMIRKMAEALRENSDL